MILKPNLLPPQFRIIRPISWKRILLLIIVSTLLIGAGYAYYLFLEDIKGLEAQQYSMEQALNQLSPTEERMNEILEKQKEIDRMKDLNGNVKAGSHIMSKILTDTARVMPQNLSFTSLSYNESSLVIKGKARDSLIVAEYVIALRQFDYFAGVEINIIGKNERIVEFMIKASINNKGGSGNV